MYKYFGAILIILTFTGVAFSQSDKTEKWLAGSKHYKFVDYGQAKVRLSVKEYGLYRLIMDYRAEHGLPEIPLSKALTYVAQTHVGDLTENYKLNEKCNIHSWSKKGKWSACCYTKDHRRADCMWNKPRELTNYNGDGFEIIYWYLWTPTTKGTLDYWKRSLTYVPVILNTGDWAKVEWKAIGIGMYDDYAAIWFGKVEDQDGQPLSPAKLVTNENKKTSN